MRFFLTIVFIVLLLPLPAKAQSTDSIQLGYDTAALILQEAQKDFQRWKDSVERDRIFRNVEENGKNLDRFLQEVREREEKERRNGYIRIGLGLLFLGALVIGLLRRRKGR